MKENLYHLAKEYIGVLEDLERIKDPEKLAALDEKRVKLHGVFMDMLKNQGIKFKDRDHATRIELRIAKEEL